MLLSTEPRTDLEPDLAVRRLKALADEKRLRILGSLAGGERCVCELQEALEGVGQSLLSFHLKALRDAGLVRDRREGRWVYYSLRREALGELGRRLSRLGSGENAPNVDRSRCP